MSVETMAKENQMVLRTDADILRLLKDATTTSNSGKRFSISVSETKHFFLWTSLVAEAPRLSLQEAVEDVSNFMFSSNQTAICLTFSDASSETKATKELSFLLVAIRVGKKTSDLIDIPTNLKFDQEESEDLKSRLPVLKRLWMNLSSRQQFYLPLYETPKANGQNQSHRRLRFWFITIVAAVLFLALAPYLVKRLNPHQHSWKRYAVGNSIGPRYQLQFSHRNISTWKADSHYNPDDWELRIDDQSMIPKALYTDKEDRYQQWFRHRYPEKEEIRQRELYANETFLSDPYSIQVDTDATFHTAHCVLALRRYWWAKESGRHVCPRDLDFRHINHCLDSLDSLVFPEGTRGPVEKEPEDDERILIWKTKVCFDE